MSRTMAGASERWFSVFEALAIISGEFCVFGDMVSISWRWFCVSRIMARVSERGFCVFEAMADFR